MTFENGALCVIDRRKFIFEVPLLPLMPALTYD